MADARAQGVRCAGTGWQMRGYGVRGAGRGAGSIVESNGFRGCRDIPTHEQFWGEGMGDTMKSIWGWQAEREVPVDKVG